MSIVGAFRAYVNLTPVPTALCGRNKQKLEALKYGCNCPANVQIFVAEADDLAAIEGSTTAFVNILERSYEHTHPTCLYTDSLCEANSGGVWICRPVHKIQ